MKVLKLKINEKEYSLCLNRDSIKYLENNGFTIDTFEKTIVNSYDLIWYTLFRAKHSDVNPSLAIKLQEEYIKDGGSALDVINFALTEYGNFITALADTKSKKELTIVEE